MTSWRDDAACVDLGTELFFIEHLRRNSSVYRDRVAQVVQPYCNKCSVRAACLRETIEEGIDYGITGGLPPYVRTHARMGNRTVVVNYE